MKFITPNLDGIPNHRYNQDAIDKTIDQIKAIAEGRNLIVLIIPSRRLWIEQRQDSHKIHQQLVRGLHGKSIFIVDLRKHFESNDNSPLSFHFKNDGHWNPAGHKLAAETLLDSEYFKIHQ